MFLGFKGADLMQNAECRMQNSELRAVALIPPYTVGTGVLDSPQKQMGAASLTPIRVILSGAQKCYKGRAV